MRDTLNPKLIDLRGSVKNPFARGFLPLVEKALAFDQINDIYRRTLLGDPRTNYFEKTLEVCGVGYTVSEDELARIPQEGPVVIVSNHPYGGMDGVAMGALLLRVRQDVRLLVNYMLNQIEPLRPWLIQVDPFGGERASRANLRGVRDSIKHLREGGCLATWPAGTVSHLHLRRRAVTDPVWNDNVAGLIRRTGATVVPVYFSGRNSNLFQVAGLIHPRLRTALLPRQLVSMHGRILQIRVGKAISFNRLERFSTDEEMTEFLRMKTYILEKRPQPEGRKRRFFPFPKFPARQDNMKPLTSAVDPAELAAEIDALPEERQLVTHGNYRVFAVRAEEIPRVMEEIARLREKTFREVGEGTGEPSDSDTFDTYYHHLFMWNAQEREIVGAYRLGLSDEILNTHGKKGLYTTTLFRFKDEFLERLNPAIELGRSFIRSEYQRKHASLSMIWRGIGEFVARNPRYRCLFGPVSISKDYHAVSKDLIVQFLKESRERSDLSPFVKARKAPRPKHLNSADRKHLTSAIKDIDDISALISEIETDQKGVPVLLRQYLKLNAVILSFNVDPAFQNCIDGLVVVDLLNTGPKIIRRFLGDQGADHFYAYHHIESVPEEDDD